MRSFASTVAGIRLIWSFAESSCDQARGDDGDDADEGGDDEVGDEGDDGEVGDEGDGGEVGDDGDGGEVGDGDPDGDGGEGGSEADNFLFTLNPNLETRNFATPAETSCPGVRACALRNSRLRGRLMHRRHD